jgi:hypothetical protein
MWSQNKQGTIPTHAWKPRYTTVRISRAQRENRNENFSKQRTTAFHILHPARFKRLLTSNEYDRSVFSSLIMPCRCNRMCVNGCPLHSLGWESTHRLLWGQSLLTLPHATATGYLQFPREMWKQFLARTVKEISNPQDSKKLPHITLRLTKLWGAEHYSRGRQLLGH